MSELTNYVNSGEWSGLFDENIRGDALGMLYNLFKWIERDNADELKLLPNGFVWSKENHIVGEFMFRVHQPHPSFYDLLRMILQLDATIQRYLEPVANSRSLYKFSAPKSHL